MAFKVLSWSATTSQITWTRSNPSNGRIYMSLGSTSYDTQNITSGNTGKWNAITASSTTQIDGAANNYIALGSCGALNSSLSFTVTVTVTVKYWSCDSISITN